MVNIAATGVIEADGKIGRVKGIEIKLKTAAELTKGGGIILFPEKNLPDISQNLKNLLKKENIKAIPVADMDQVFDILFKKEAVPPCKKRFLSKSVLLMGLILMVGTILMGAWIYLINPIKTDTVRPIKEEKQIKTLSLETEEITLKKAMETDPLPDFVQSENLGDHTPLPADATKPSPHVNEPEAVDNKGFE